MKKAIILFYIVLVASKFMLASHLDLFGDEAFYWQCAQRPSFSYIDHPPLTAMLVRAGTEILGDTSLGVRFFFLVCGALFPIAMYLLMLPLIGNRDSWLAAGATMVFPGTAYLGLVAIPDVPMVLIGILFAICFEQATRKRLTKFWVFAGICGAMGFLTHYRFILLPLSAFIYLTMTSNGRSHLSKIGPWLAGALLLLGLVPVLIFNFQTNFEPVRYYLSGRHTLTFSLETFLMFFLKQILLATPFLFIGLIGSMVVLLKEAMKNNDRAVLFSIFSLTPLLVFFVASPFEDSGLTTIHWPIPGYIFLLPYVPTTIIGFVKFRPTFFRKLFAYLTAGLSIAVMIILVIELRFGWLNLEGLRRPFSGWSEVSDRLKEKHIPNLLKEKNERLITAADNYVLGANLDFLLHDLLDLYILEHKRNREHGRAYQYRIWDTDEKALKRHVGKNALIIIEETTLRPLENWKLQKHLCNVFESTDYIDEVDSMDGRKRFVFFQGNKIRDENSKLSNVSQSNKCGFTIFSYLDRPRPGSIVSGLVKIEGWAFKDGTGITSVEILKDGNVIGTARYGISRPGVKKLFTESYDPNHPNVGFTFHWDCREIEPGEYFLAIRVKAEDGMQRVMNTRRIIVSTSEGNKTSR